MKRQIVLDLDERDVDQIFESLMRDAAFYRDEADDSTCDEKARRAFKRRELFIRGLVRRIQSIDPV